MNTEKHQVPESNLSCIAIGNGTASPPMKWSVCQFRHALFASASREAEPLLVYSLNDRRLQETLLLEDAQMGNPHSVLPRTEQQVGGPFAFSQISADKGSRLFVSGNFKQQIHLACASDRDQQFTPVNAPGNGSVQQLLSFRKLFFALTDGKTGGPSPQRLYVSNRPPQGAWQAINLPIEELAAGQHISHIANFNGQLYLTIDDEVNGFQLWRCKPDNSQTYSWNQVVTSGAYHHSANARVTALYADNERLLIGSAATEALMNLKDRPVAAELLSVESDGSWNLIIGTTRHSDEGLIVPIGGMGRGFDTPHGAEITAIWRSDDGYMVSTRPHLVHNEGVSGQLWSSHDLLEWQALPLPEALNFPQVTLLGIYPLPIGELYIIHRQPEEDPHIEPAADSTATELVTQVLPSDIEFWLSEHGTK